MPRGDRTGPGGMGPMTGRGAGYCSGSSVPGFMNCWGGRGGGYGRGFGLGQGRGMGMGAGFPDPGAAGAPQLPPAAGKKEELSMLKQQAEAMAEQMKQIQERIEQLGKEEQ